MRRHVEIRVIPQHLRTCLETGLRFAGTLNVHEIRCPGCLFPGSFIESTVNLQRLLDMAAKITAWRDRPHLFPVINRIRHTVVMVNKHSRHQYQKTNPPQPVFPPRRWQANTHHGLNSRIVDYASAASESISLQALQRT